MQRGPTIFILFCKSNANGVKEVTKNNNFPTLGLNLGKLYEILNYDDKYVYVKASEFIEKYKNLEISIQELDSFLL